MSKATYKIMKAGNKRASGKIEAVNAEMALRDWCETKPDSEWGYIQRITGIDADQRGTEWATAETNGGTITAQRI